MRPLRVLSLGLTVVVGASLAASALKIELPRETAAYRPGSGVELANARCLTCHSADYVATQPPMPLAFWKGAVQKMRQKYGAEIPESEVEALAAYLTSAYGVPSSSPTASAPAAVPSAGGSLDAQALAERHGCLSCHRVDAKLVGPAFRDIAAKYNHRRDGPAKIARQITRGGGGQWGSVPMPSFESLPSEDVQALTEWILGLSGR